MRLRLLSYLVVLALGAVLGVLGYRWFTTPEVRIVTRDNTVTVTVDRPVLQTRDVVRYVEDKAEVARLMQEAAASRDEVLMLTETIARLEAAGTGQVTYIDRPVPGETQVVREAHFQDWRLKFDAVDSAATYSLTQKFEALTAVGKDSKGQPTASVRLFEIGPGEVRTPLTDAKTTVVAANPEGARWRAGLALQAGVGLSSTLTGSKAAVAVVGLPWLRRGTSGAAEDSSLALLTPALIVGQDIAEPALLPFSVNLGRKLPLLDDIWASPLIGVDAKAQRIGRLGVAFVATF